MFVGPLIWIHNTSTLWYANPVMSRLFFFQFWPFTTNKICPTSWKIYQRKFEILQSTICQRLKILPKRFLVTLLTQQKLCPNKSFKFVSIVKAEESSKLLRFYRTKTKVICASIHRRWQQICSVVSMGLKHGLTWCCRGLRSVWARFWRNCWRPEDHRFV